MKNSVLFAIMLLSASCARLPAADESARLESIFDRFFQETIARNPEEATQMGLPREMGFRFDRAGLTDYSDGGIEERYRLYRTFLKELKSVDAKRISPQQRIDRKSLIWLIEATIEGNKFWHHQALLGHLFGAHMQVLNLMTEYHGIGCRQDADDYLKRLERLPSRLEQIAKQIERQANEKKLPPKYIIDRTLGSMAGFRSAAPDSNMMVVAFRQKLDALQGMEPKEKAMYAKQATDLVSGAVYPAYDGLISACRQAREKAPEDGGVWTMPEGDKYYKWCLKYYTSSNIDPEELHRLGMGEVERLQERARKLLESMGISQKGSFADLMRAYWASQQRPEYQKYQYPQTEAGRKQALADNRAWLDSAWQRLPRIFEDIPGERVEVKPVPQHKAGGGTSYYEPAPADGSRQAVYYLNMTNIWPKPTLEPVLYHETIPGHHLQIALQHRQSQNRMYRNLFFLAGFGEGWAMYAQALADELRWYDDPHTRLAEINSQLFRAVRIVVDTGIHLKRWSKRQALAYMEENLGWGSENEVDRYIVWPGQACSYTFGKIKIMELRERAKAKMDGRFDLRKFHTAVLGHGTIPLDVLEEVVKEYTEKK